MKPPTDKQFLAWYAAQPQGDYTCAWCGKVGPRHYVQPQHPFWADKTGVDGRAPACCTDCHGIHAQERKAQRKTQLAAEPRCEVTSCKRRGTWRTSGALLCGQHLKAARAGHHRATASFGILGGLMEYDKLDVLRWAHGK